jgi:preprotein translocase subunit YajC
VGTGGGALARVTKVGEAYLPVEISKDTPVVIQRASIQTVLPKGTIASA